MGFQLLPFQLHLVFRLFNLFHTWSWDYGIPMIIEYYLMNGELEGPMLPPFSLSCLTHSAVQALLQITLVVFGVGILRSQVEK